MHSCWRVCVARTWISYRCVPYHPWYTHRKSLVVKKKKTFQFSCGCEQFQYGRSIGFLVINVCNQGEHYETPCISIATCTYTKLRPTTVSLWHCCAAVSLSNSDRSTSWQHIINGSDKHLRFRRYYSIDPCREKIRCRLFAIIRPRTPSTWAAMYK